MLPTIGRVVLYTLGQGDVDTIALRRAARAEREGVTVQHLGNPVAAGDVYPATVVRVWPECVSLQVALDGADGLWVTSRYEGDEPGTWAWPPRA